MPRRSGLRRSDGTYWQARTCRPRGYRDESAGIWTLMCVSSRCGRVFCAPGERARAIERDGNLHAYDIEGCAGPVVRGITMAKGKFPSSLPDPGGAFMCIPAEEAARPIIFYNRSAYCW
jgi:hypothetical protein